VKYIIIYNIVSEVVPFRTLSSFLLFLCVSFKCNKLAHKVLVYIHHSSVVVKVTTVILGRKNGNQLLVLSEETISIFHDLMSSANQIEVMLFEEFFKLFPSKNEATASFVLFPVSHVVIWVIP
jgi:hypothetical protein